MPTLRHLVLWLALFAAAGCASRMAVEVPSANLIDSTRRDYRAFVNGWMTGQPSKPIELRSPGQPSAAFRIAATTDTAVVQQFHVLNQAFQRWCVASGAVVKLQDELLDRSKGFRTCVVDAPTAGRRIAMLYLYLEDDLPGQRSLVAMHWYPEDADRYVQAVQARRAEQIERFAASTELRSQQQTASRAERQAMDAEALARLATSARLKPTPQCLQFERESNALRARFNAALEQAAFLRYLSDLSVSFDECANARPGPNESLLAVYRFNLSSFRLFSDAWEQKLINCDSDGRCAVDDRAAPEAVQRQLARLQARYPVIGASPPERPKVIIDRVQRFALER